MGTQANDLAALKKKVGGEFDYNRAKIEHLFGPDAVKRLTAAIDREQHFSNNFADITRNSQTAQRTAATKSITEADAPRISGNETALGLTRKGTAKIANALISRVFSSASQPTRDALVRALTKKGAEGERFMLALKAMSGRSTSAIAR